MTTSVPTTRPPKDFMPWMDPYGMNRVRPTWYRVIEIWQPGSTEILAIDPKSMHPMQNVAHLYWRPVM